MGRWSSSESEGEQEAGKKSYKRPREQGELKLLAESAKRRPKAIVKGFENVGDSGCANSEKQNREEKPRQVNETKRLCIGSACRSVFNYEMVGRSGEGSYGVVYKAREKESGKIVALKQVKMKKVLCQEGFPISSLRETNVMLALQHPNIVGVREIVVEELQDEEEREQCDSDEDDFGPYRVYMVMDYWQVELKALMQEMKEPFTQSEVKCIMKQLLQALAFIHGKWFIHRDLKSSNILYNNDGSVAICDFGLARKYEDPPGKSTELVITLHYRPPELLLGAQKYSTKVDIWSMGCIFAELLQNKVLFHGTNEMNQLTKIFDLVGTPNINQWPQVQDLKFYSKFQSTKSKSSKLHKLLPDMPFAGRPYLSPVGTDLLQKLLTLNPEERISAAEALKHPWFQEYPLAKDKSLMPKASV